MKRSSGDSAAITPILMEIVFKETLNGLTLKKEAVAAESAFMQIKVVGDQDVSFYEVTLKWYEFKSRTLKPSTLDTKRVYLNMLSPFNDKKMAKITYLDIDNFFRIATNQIL